MKTGAAAQADLSMDVPARGLICLLAGACGIIAAGSYIAQPLAPGIARELHIAPSLAGLVVTLSQIGYCLGLLFVSSLADRLENRSLLTMVLSGSVLSMLLAACAPAGGWFLLACFGIGGCSVGVQLIVAQAALLCDPVSRGRVVGSVTSGLLFGILLAWPVAHVFAHAFGWRALFGLEALALVILIVCLRYALPMRQPQARQSYVRILASLTFYWHQHDELRRRAYIQGLLFGVFSMTWTVLPVWLRQRYGFEASGMAAFGLAGASGALVAPFAGRLADRGHARVTTIMAILAVALGCAAMCFSPPWWGLLLAVIAIDGGVQASHVVSQRRVLSLDLAAANRLNSLYVGSFFLGGAMGSALAMPVYQGHAAGVGVSGTLAGMLALALAWSSRRSESAYGE